MYHQNNAIKFLKRFRGIKLFLCSLTFFLILKDQYEREDFQIKPTDNFILAGKTEKDCCSLEVYGECV